MVFPPFLILEVIVPGTPRYALQRPRNLALAWFSPSVLNRFALEPAL